MSVMTPHPRSHHGPRPAPRARVAVVAIALVVTAVLLPSAVVTRAAGAETPASSLYFESDAGDPMGAGRTRLATSADSTFGSYDNGGPWTAIGVSGPIGWVVVELWGPGGEHLVPGTYEHASILPGPGQAKFDVSWSGEGSCNSAGGSDATVTVHEVEYAGTLFSKLSVSFRVTCTGASGSYAGELRYNSSTPTYPAILQAPATRSPFDFGSIAVGATSSATTYTLTNGGAGAVDLGDGTPGGAAPGDFIVTDDSCSGASLDVGASCSFAVRFAPTAAGTRTATLTFGATTALGQRRVSFIGTALVPTVTTLDLPADMVFGPFTVTAHTRPAPTLPPGYLPAMTFLVDGAFAAHGIYNAQGDATETLDLQPGAHTVQAVYGGSTELAPSQSDPATVAVGATTQTWVTSSLNPALSTHSVTITATVASQTGVPGGGTLSVVDAFDGSTIASTAIDPATTSVSVTRTFAVGTHELTASYTGHETFGPSEGRLTQVSQPDLDVQASGLGLQYAKFYPVSDGYRDTVEVRGRLGEPASVLIEFFSSTNVLVTRADLGPRQAGAYAFAWNGRNAAGSILGTGQYRVVQRITDAAGNDLKATHFVTLSKKKLVWSSHTISRYGDQYGTYGDPGSGSVSQAKSAYARGVRLSSGTSWVAVRYTFTLRSAVVYGPLKFKVLGRSRNGTKGYAGLWNRTYGSSFYIDNYDVRTVGPGYAWYGISLDPTSHRKDRTAFGMVFVGYLNGTRTFDVAKVRLAYRYAVLE